MADVTSEPVTFDDFPGERPGETFGETPPSAPTRTEALAGFLDAIEATRTPEQAGGVPIPAAWECVRAVLGRVPRETLERAHDHTHTAPGTAMHADQLHASDHVTKAALKGSHLPAGLHVITGQTGGGKSALVTSLGLAAAQGGHPVLYVSLELDGEELAARVLALASGVPWYKLSLGEPLTTDETTRRNAGRATLNAARVPERFLVYAPTGALDVGAVRREAFAAWQEWGKVPLVVLDYLQLSTVLTEQFRLPLREAIAAVVVELRHLSRRDKTQQWPGCPVVLLSTTARTNTKKNADAPEGLTGENPDALRRDNMEVLKGLPKEAGEIEATAVTAWVVALGEKSEHGTRRLALRLVKNRLGIPGAWVPFVFDGATGQLTEAPGRYADARAEDRAAALARDDKKNGKAPTPTAASASVMDDELPARRAPRKPR